MLTAVHLAAVGEDQSVAPRLLHHEWQRLLRPCPLPENFWDDETKAAELQEENRSLGVP